VEIALRIKLKIHIYELAHIIESGNNDHQWDGFKLRDNNSKYFDVIASYRSKTNYIPILDIPNTSTIISQTTLILDAFSTYYKELLGTETTATATWPFHETTKHYRFFLPRGNILTDENQTCSVSFKAKRKMSDNLVIIIIMDAQL
jgi:hypothetical protein